MSDGGPPVQVKEPPRVDAPQPRKPVGEIPIAGKRDAPSLGSTRKPADTPATGDSPNSGPKGEDRKASTILREALALAPSGVGDRSSTMLREAMTRWLGGEKDTRPSTILRAALIGRATGNGDGPQRAILPALSREAASRSDSPASSAREEPSNEAVAQRAERPVTTGLAAGRGDFPPTRDDQPAPPHRADVLGAGVQNVNPLGEPRRPAAMDAPERRVGEERQNSAVIGSAVDRRHVTGQPSEARAGLQLPNEAGTTWTVDDDNATWVTDAAGKLVAHFAADGTGSMWDDEGRVITFDADGIARHIDPSGQQWTYGSITNEWRRFVPGVDGTKWRWSSDQRDFVYDGTPDARRPRLEWVAPDARTTIVEKHDHLFRRTPDGLFIKYGGEVAQLRAPDDGHTERSEWHRVDESTFIAQLAANSHLEHIWSTPGHPAQDRLRYASAATEVAKRLSELTLQIVLTTPWLPGRAGVVLAELGEALLSPPEPGDRLGLPRLHPAHVPAPGGRVSHESTPKAPRSHGGEAVWVNKHRRSQKYHLEGSAQAQRVEQDAGRGRHWEEMTREQAERQGFTAAKVGDPTRQKALGEERVREFLDDYKEGGRGRMFGTPLDPQAVYQEVPLYSKVVVKGKEFYVPSSPKRVLDIVDLTEPRRPKALEIGTQTPSSSEILRKDGQTYAWEEAKVDARSLRKEGGDGRIYGWLKPSGDAPGRFVDLSDAEYLIPPDVRHLLRE